MPRTDVVIVFPYKTDAMVNWGDDEQRNNGTNLRAPTDVDKHKMETWKTKRHTALSALNDAGLIIMLYYSRDRDEIFCRIAADERHLRAVAEMKKYKLELKPLYLSAFAEYQNDYAGKKELSYKDRRVVNHLYKTHADFDAEGNHKYPTPDKIFRTVDRIRLIDHIIRSGDHNCANVDIGQLQHDEDVVHYFPLHENKKLQDLDKDWFKAFAWGTNIDKVRDYYGERIALYFLFMSHLNKWLVAPAIIGLGFWLYDTLPFGGDGSADNKSEVYVCIGMGFWSMLFVHFWRRTCATASARWGTIGLGVQLEETRPEFRGVNQINPVTGRIDRFYPWSQRIWKVLFSYTALSVTIIILLFCVSCLFALRHVFAHRGWGRVTFQIINAIAVEGMNIVFTSLAKWLTERENHRAYSEFANNLLAKTVIFKFINCYISLYYIAFFKQHSHLFGMPMECVQGDCLNDLSTQLAVFMIMRLTVQNIVELSMPYVLMMYRSMMEGRTFHTSLFTNPLTVMPDLSSPERQAKKETFDLYEDMDEVLITYGYTTLFVVACPWVPFLALLSNLLECFLDQKKLVLLYRRPFPMMAADNEPWDTAFDVFGNLAMITNVAIVVFTARAFDQHWTHTHKLMLFLAVEHALIFGRLMVSVFLPAMPQVVRMLLMQQRMILHKHVNLNGDEDDHETRASAMLTAVAPAPYIYDQDDDDFQ